MKIIDFEKKIQTEIDPDLNIRINPNHSDIAGVYWNNIYISVAVPPEEIKEEVSKGYTDIMGNPYKSIDTATMFIEGQLKKYKKALAEDPNFFD